MNSEKSDSRRIRPIENLTMREVEKLARVWPEEYSVMIFETSEVSGCWAVELTFSGKQMKRYGVETGRETLKMWKTLLGAMEFVKDFCPAASHVSIDFRGWEYLYKKSDAEAA
jgi:hypothetical protein